MFVADLMVALVSGLIIALIVSKAFGTKGPWGSFLWFFIVVSLFAWTGGVWLMPFGPRWGGVSWFPIIWMGILVALLLTAVSPRTSIKQKTVTDKVEVADKISDMNAALWVVVFCLLIFGIAHYATHSMLAYWHEIPAGAYENKGLSK
jgi:hypothetical protein